MSTDNQFLGLADSLNQLRSDLLQVESEGSDSELKLRIEKAELELTMVAASKAGGEVGMKWYILSASASGEVSSVSTQKLSLTLGVVDKTGSKKDIGGVDE